MERKGAAVSNEDRLRLLAEQPTCLTLEFARYKFLYIYDIVTNKNIKS